MWRLREDPPEQLIQLLYTANVDQQSLLINEAGLNLFLRRSKKETARLYSDGLYLGTDYL